jgi:hypothetical protein
MTLDKASTALSIWDLLKTIVTAAIAFAGAMVLMFRAVKTNRRLAKNLGRQIFVYCPPGVKRSGGENKDMKREISVLRNSGYFSLPSEPVTDFHQIEHREIEKAGVMVIGYDQTMSHFEELVELAKRFDKPLIIYTFELGLQLTAEHKKALDSYKWYTLSSMPLRLVSDVFAVMASFNYEK